MLDSSYSYVRQVELVVRVLPQLPNLALRSMVARQSTSLSASSRACPWITVLPTCRWTIAMMRSMQLMMALAGWQRRSAR